MQTQRRDFGPSRGRRRWDKFTEYHCYRYATTCKTDSERAARLYNRRASTERPVTAERWNGAGRGAGAAAHVDMCPIHVVWQKPTHYCTRSTLQLKINEKIKKQTHRHKESDLWLPSRRERERDGWGLWG